MTTSRRRWLAAAGLGAVAAGAGAAAYVWQRRAPADPVAEAFWALELETPHQPPQRLQTASLRGRPLVLNFWATWCPPCVREMPALDRFFRDHRPRGWQVLGLAADNATDVRAFLARAPVNFPVGLAGFAGIELSRQFGNPSGGLPFTVLFDGRGAVAHRHVGETHYDQLTGWASGIS